MKPSDNNTAKGTGKSISNTTRLPMGELNRMIVMRKLAISLGISPQLWSGYSKLEYEAIEATGIFDQQGDGDATDHA